MRIPYVDDFIERVAPKTKEELMQHGMVVCFGSATLLSFGAGLYAMDAFNQVAQYRAATEAAPIAPVINSTLGTLINLSGAAVTFTAGFKTMRASLNLGS